MGILKSDIKLMASERLTDFHDGGGRMTGNEILSGELNNLFPDISRLDRVYGRVSLRKFFPSVMTDNVDMYYGSHIIVTDPPEDDNVFVTLFTRNDFDDVRDDAKDRMESYVSIAHTLALQLLNDQLEGQRAITCFARISVILPKIGDTIVLTNNASGEQQYQRITNIETERQQFVQDGYGNFSVEVVTLGLSAALQTTFPGISATPYTRTGDTSIHATVVADASNYYGVSKVTQSISQGDLNLKIDSIFNQLVPTSQIETPLVDQLMGSDSYTMHQISPNNAINYTTTRTQSTATVHLPVGVLPGSLQLTIGSFDFVDNGGQLEVATLDGADGGYGGAIDYRTGQIDITSTGSWSLSVTVIATPAVAVVESFITREIYIELANRAFNYVPSLTEPLPTPGSVTVDFMAQGSWYRLRDNGRGVLVGDQPNTGTGTIDYGTGSLIVTVGALPDVGSSIIVSWGHGSSVTNRSGDASSQPFVVHHTLPHQGIKPTSVTVTWGDTGEFSMTDSAGDSLLIGDGTGMIAYASGEILFTPTPIPASGAVYQIEYQQQDTETHTVVASTTFSLPGAPIRPKSVNLSWKCKRIRSESEDKSQETFYHTYVATDDGLGRLFASVPVLSSEERQQIGTVNYETGEVLLSQNVWDYEYPRHYTTTTVSTVWVSRPK